MALACNPKAQFICVINAYRNGVPVLLYLPTAQGLLHKGCLKSHERKKEKRSTVLLHVIQIDKNNIDNNWVEYTKLSKCLLFAFKTFKMLTFSLKLSKCLLFV